MKHDYALGKNGVKYTPSDIFDIHKLVDMRYYGLTDLNEQFELVAVNGKDKKYFRFKHSPGTDLTRNENNPSHEKVKNELLELLVSKNSLIVYTNEFIKYTDKDGNEQSKSSPRAILHLTEKTYSSYEWKTEVFKRVNRDEYTLFDICGYSKDIAFPTSAKPNIIFEIIVSSFPKEPVFRFLCDDSETNFTLCFFIYVPEDAIKRKSLKYYWNEISNDGNELLKIRTTQYIDNGYFYKNEKQIEGKGDKPDDNDTHIRPSINTISDLDKYWGKHYLFIKERYFKGAIKQLND